MERLFGPRYQAIAATKIFSACSHGRAAQDSLRRFCGLSPLQGNHLGQQQEPPAEVDAKDHRQIGRQQDLYFFNQVSPGSCFWTHHGTKIYNKLQEFMRREYRARGFHEIITPNIYAADLFKKSGHYQNYREDMYGLLVEGQEWFLKPMNCPGHCIMFDRRPRSYRELPLRLASFGVLHRNELSGALSGLTRVRRFQQDDAHIFCREDQIRSEVTAALLFTSDVYQLFGFEYEFFLATRPSKALGGEELWMQAEDQLREALNETGVKYGEKKGDGAFYGPKIDIQLKDALGRKHQCATIQLDFQLPSRFNLRYSCKGSPVENGDCAGDLTTEVSDTLDHCKLPDGFARPVIIHRAIFGSLERMIAVLCEHFAGKWPFWLSPRQCIVVPVSEDTYEYARYVRDVLHARGFFVEADFGSGTLKKKVRDAQLAQWNYVLVVGKNEEQMMSASLRARGNKKSLGNHDLAKLIEQFEDENTPLALKRPTQLEPFKRSEIAATSKIEIGNTVS